MCSPFSPSNSAGSALPQTASNLGGLLSESREKGISPRTAFWLQAARAPRRRAHPDGRACEDARADEREGGSSMGRGYYGRGRGRGRGEFKQPEPVFVCAPCGKECHGESNFLQHCFGAEHQRVSGVCGFAGIAPNRFGVMPPLSDDFFTRIEMGPAALLQPPPGKPDKFYMTQYKCAACGTTISGHVSFVEHCKGRAHIKAAGYAGFAGLLPNDANIIPSLPAHIAVQIGAQPGPQLNAAEHPMFAAAAAAQAATAQAAATSAAASAAEKPAHSVRMDRASLQALTMAARAHDGEKQRRRSPRRRRAARAAARAAAAAAAAAARAASAPLATSRAAATARRTTCTSRARCRRWRWRAGRWRRTARSCPSRRTGRRCSRRCARTRSSSSRATRAAARPPRSRSSSSRRRRASARTSRSCARSRGASRRWACRSASRRSAASRLRGRSATRSASRTSRPPRRASSSARPVSSCVGSRRTRRCRARRTSSSTRCTSGRSSRTSC